MNNKFKDNKGITILHALVSLAMFTVISSIIYSSSVANMQSYKNQQSYQQAYLTVSSAANTFVDSINGDIIEHVVVYRIVNGSEVVHSETWSYIDTGLENPLVKNATLTSQSGDDFLNDFAKITINPSETTVEKVYYISADGKTPEGESKELTTVYVKTVMGAKTTASGSSSVYDLSVNFYLNPDELSTGDDNYYMRVYLPVETDYTVPYSTNSNSGKVSYDGNDYPTITRTYHIQYDTPNMEIEKGVFSY